MEEQRETINSKELKIIEFWKKDKAFEKSLKKTEKNKPYIFYDGPPFATGLPHYGHILGSVTKDLFGRFWTMNGRYVRRVWGWDCHGLPIENIAEKGLGINSKDEIEKMGVDKFNNYCREQVLEYAETWKKVIERIGRWVDMDNAYKTMDNEYIESVWWAFKQLYEKGYIYEGEKILMYCPRCSTPLAKAEIAMDNSYKTVKDSTIVVKFKLNEKINGENVYALAWTTTPWTLPSNLALAVNPNLNYSFIKDNKDGSVYLLGKDLIKTFFKDANEYKVLKEVLGKELEGKKYEPLFPYFNNTKNAFQIILGNFVTAEDGTGIVHTAPNFGEDDYDVCKKYKIPVIDSVDEKGLFKEAVKDFAGKYVHDSNDDVIIFLKKAGKVVLVKKVEHEYPFCYRCETKLMYRAIPAWFVDIQKIKDKILKLNKKLNWYPQFLKEGRVKYTIETAPDWNISRNRYWATAIPIWQADDGEKLVIGSIEDLKKYCKKLPKKVDLHKDFLDGIILEKDGKKFKRIPEVLDCWFESGAMTFAQFHYPFENKELFEKNFPAQFVAEYIGQVRAWFYYMSVLSAILFDDIPFENVVTTGTILAEDGQKMSKSKKNFPDPMLIIEKYGTDALRFYLMSTVVMNADNLNFSEKSVDEIYKKVMVLLYNVNNFYSLYKTEEAGDNKSKKVIDKWILSRLNQTNEAVSKYLEEYNTIKACSEIRQFIEDLSTWYVRRNRDRFNEGDAEAVKTLKFVLSEFSKITAPIMPFVSEIIWQTIGNKESVHLQDWPKAGKKIDETVLKEMSIAREVVSTALKERDRIRIALKQPLATLKVTGAELDKEYTDIIAEELNVKKVSLHKGKELKIELDTKITPELEAEGYTREIARKIQAERKNMGLKTGEMIKMRINCDEDLRKKLEMNLDFLKDRTNCSEIRFVSEKLKIEFEVRDKKGSFEFDCSLKHYSC